MLSRNLDLQDVLAKRYLGILGWISSKCMDIPLVGDGLDVGGAPAMTEGTLHA